jgi:hypothetical protein
MLSGCFFGVGKKVSAPEIGKAPASSDRAKQIDKHIPNEKTVKEKEKIETCPPKEEKLLSQLISLQSPESLVPVTSSISRSQMHSEPSPGIEATKVRSEMAIRVPDFVYHDEILTEDTVWHGEVLIVGGVTIASQTTLTVKDGTVIRFRGNAGAMTKGVLVVQGRIVVNGSVDKPVLFTTMFENMKTGDWQGIVLLGSGKKNLIENCRIEGAEIGFDASFSSVEIKNTFFSKCRTGLRIQDCLVAMTGGGVGECGSGMIIYDSEADIRSADFFGNRLGFFATRTSLSLAGSNFTGNNLLALKTDKCRLIVNGNSFTANGNGLALVDSEGSLSGNRIAQNAIYGLVLARSRVKVHGNEIIRNGKVGLRIEDGKGIAWGNSLFANGEYDLYNDGGEEFRAIENWWGDAVSDIERRIFDRRMDDCRGRVLYIPVLRTRPLLNTP